MSNQNENKNAAKKRRLIGIPTVLALIAIVVGFYLAYRPTASQGTKAYTLEVVNDNGETKTYSGKTDAEYLRGLMDELAAKGDFSYEGSDSDYGLYISTINGLTADYDADGAYWAIYVNDEYGMYGADSQPVTSGDDYKLVYEVYAE